MRPILIVLLLCSSASARTVGFSVTMPNGSSCYRVRSLAPGDKAPSKDDLVKDCQERAAVKALLLSTQGVK